MFTLSLINPTTEIPFFTRATRNAVWSTTRAGEERLRAIIDGVSLSDAVALFDKATFAFVRISKNAEIAWQGVVTDVQLTYDNNTYALVVNAVGYVFLLQNAYVTAFISTTDITQFFLLSDEAVSNAVNDSRVRLEISHNILVKVRENSTFYPGERICIGYRLPSIPVFPINHVEFSVTASLVTPFNYRIYGVVNHFIDAPWAISDTTNYTPSPYYPIFISLPTQYTHEAIIFAFVADSTFTVTSDMYFKIYNVRLLTTLPPITASKVIKTFGMQVISNVQSESDLLDIVIEDKTKKEILDMVCQQDNLEYTILKPDIVELRKRTDLENRTRYRIVAETFGIARDATTIVNSAYATYREPGTNYKYRTARSINPISLEVFSNNVYRDAVVDVNTFDDYIANEKRDELLATASSGSMRLRATTRNVATASQSPVPNWKVRAGAIAGIVNLGRIGYGQVSEVIIDRTDYDAATDTLTIESQIDAL